MEKLRSNIFDMESNITELSGISAKINAAIEDITAYYFDSLCKEEDSRYYKNYFKGAEIRKNIIADYALQLQKISEVLEEYCNSAFERIVELINADNNCEAL